MKCIYCDKVVRGNKRKTSKITHNGTDYVFHNDCYEDAKSLVNFFAVILTLGFLRIDIKNDADKGKDSA